MHLLKEEKITSRIEIQQRGINYIKNSSFIIYEYPTSLGKSYTAIMALDYLLTKNPNYKVLWLEPEIPLITNIKKEFVKFKKTNLLKNITIICYASLHKTFGQAEYSYQYEIIVADEIHHLFSDKRFNYIQEQKNVKAFIGLSATIYEDNIEDLEGAFKKEFLVHKVDLKNAMDWNILPNPDVYLIGLSLNEKDRKLQYEYKRGVASKRKSFTTNVYGQWKYIKDRKNYPNLSLTIKCTEKQYYDQLCYKRNQARKRYEEWKKSGDLDNTPEKLYLYSELNIKRFLANLKTKDTVQLLKKHLKDRFLAFVGSIAQEEELKKALPQLNIINSQIKESNDLIEDFNSKKISNLVSVNKIQEGANLTDIEVLIISQLDSNARSQVQRFGRGLRSKHPQIYILYYKDTKDYGYVEKALQYFDKNSLTLLEEKDLWTK